MEGKEELMNKESNSSENAMRQAQAVFAQIHYLELKQINRSHQQAYAKLTLECSDMQTDEKIHEDCEMATYLQSQLEPDQVQCAQRSIVQLILINSILKEKGHQAVESAKRTMHSLRIKINVLNSKEVFKIFELEEGVKIRNCQQSMKFNRNQQGNYIFYATQVTKDIFSIFLGDLKKPGTSLICGSDGCGKTSNAYLFSLLTRNIIKVKRLRIHRKSTKLQIIYRDLDLQKIFIAIPKMLVFSLQDQINQMKQTILDQCQQIDRNELKKGQQGQPGQLERMYYKLQRMYRENEIQISFAIDNVSWYYRHLCQFLIKRNVGLADLHQRLSLIMREKLRHLASSSQCKIFLLLQSSLNLLIFSYQRQIQRHIYQFPSNQSILHNTHQIVYSKILYTQIGKQELQSVVAFQIRKLLLQILPQDANRRQLIPSVLKKCFQVIRLNPIRYFTSFKFLRIYVEAAKKSVYNIISKFAADSFLLTQAIVKVIQENVNSPSPVMEKNLRQRLLEFVSQDPSQYKCFLRKSILQIIRREAQSQPKLLNYFKIQLSLLKKNIMEANDLYQDQQQEDNDPCEKDLSEQVLRNCLYKEYMIMNQEEIVVYISPVDYLQLTECIQDKHPSFSLKIPESKSSEGSQYERKMIEVIANQTNLELKLGIIDLNIRVFSFKQPCPFLHFKTKKHNFQISAHFKEAIQRLRSLQQKQAFLVCVPTNLDGSHSPNSPSFDIVFFRIINDVYQITSIDFTVTRDSSRIISATKEQSPSKAKTKSKDSKILIQEIIKSNRTDIDIRWTHIILCLGTCILSIYNEKQISKDQVQGYNWSIKFSPIQLFDIKSIKKPQNQQEFYKFKKYYYIGQEIKDKLALLQLEQSKRLTKERLPKKSEK